MSLTVSTVETLLLVCLACLFPWDAWRFVTPTQSVVLINTFVPRSWEHEVNATLARAAGRYPNVLLVNWHNAIDHHQGMLWNDGIHPQPIGGKLYATVVRRVVMEALRKQPTLHRPTLHRPTLHGPVRPHVPLISFPVIRFPLRAGYARLY